LAADQVTNFKVKVRILDESYSDLTEGKPQSYSPFRPGMTATVDIITERRPSAVSAPISAIVIKTDTSTVKKSGKNEVATSSSISEEKFECVFVNNNGKAKLKVVKTGIQDDTNIEVTEGLEEGDEIITGPYNVVSKTLKSGDAVEVEGAAKKTSEASSESTE